MYPTKQSILNSIASFIKSNGLVLLLLIQFTVSAKKPKAIVSIPFDNVGSYIVIKVKINDSNPLNLILDSGIKNTIITELMENDSLSLYYTEEKDLLGLGAGTNLKVYTSNVNTLQLKKITISPSTVLVLKEDIFNLSQHTGTEINGLIGVDLFQDYIVEVNYSQNRVRFYEHTNFRIPSAYSTLPIEIEGKKMFIEPTLVDHTGNSIKIKMLIDTGAELNAWFQTYKSNSVAIPHKSLRATIGQGLNGEIKGQIGRISQLCFGPYCLKNPVVSFPDSASIVDIIANSNRDGTVGSQLLSRFNFFIDFKNKLFYFKPNESFKKSFNYNIAGIEVLQILPFYPQTEVWRVWENSPAYFAGVQPGDQIVEVNGHNGFKLTINEIKQIFETPTKSTLKLTVSRNNELIDFEIDMTSRL